MVLIRRPKPWHDQRPITPESVLMNRRTLLKTMALAGTGVAIAPLIHSRRGLAIDNPLQGVEPLAANTHSRFADAERPITDRILAATYNNFYEFDNTKSIWQAAQALPTDDWQLEVSGRVKYPKTYTKEDLYTAFPLEERVYRHRCVEAWAMVVPWIGFPMKALMDAVEPMADATYVRFISYYDPAITSGPPSWNGSLPFPYYEGLRIEEMAAEVAFFAVGIYGHTLPKQHGAPIRMVVPWKYGYKSAKSLVKIEFVTEQPSTFWNTLYPDEYSFESNVNPNVPHPRWSQATERMLTTTEPDIRPTLLYNGYEEFVAHLYS